MYVIFVAAMPLLLLYLRLATKICLWGSAAKAILRCILKQLSDDMSEDDLFIEEPISQKCDHE